MPVSAPSNASDVSPELDWPATRGPTQHSNGLSLRWVPATDTLMVGAWGGHDKLRIQTRPRFIYSHTKPRSLQQGAVATANTSFDLRRILDFYWAPEDGHGQLLLRFGQENSMAAAGFVRSLGLEDGVLKVIAEFPRRAHVAMLRSATEVGPLFYRRLATQPVIAFMISACTEFATVAEVSRHGLCSMKTRDVVRALGFDLPSSVIRKIPPNICSTNNLKALQRLKDKRIKRMLCHVPTLSRSLFDLLSVCTRAVAPWIGFGLMKELCGEQRPSDTLSVKQVLTSVATSARRLAIKPFRIESLESLVRLDERLITEVAQKTALECLEFPACPLVFPATDLACRLVPVRTPRELHVLAREYKNCAFGYAWAIATGRVLIFSGETPDGERIMLRLIRFSTYWHPVEVRGVRNAEVAVETQNVIYRRIAEVQGLKADAFNSVM